MRLPLDLISVLLSAFALATSASSAERSQSVVSRLNRGLAGTPLAGTGAELERAGRRHRISPYFMAAVAGKESSLGRVPCRENPRNVWGLGACDRAWRVPYFDTWAEAASYYARFLRRHWPRARTPWDFHGYCVTPSGATCPDWAPAVASFMRTLFRVGPSVSYP